MAGRLECQAVPYIHPTSSDVLHFQHSDQAITNSSWLLFTIMSNGYRKSTCSSWLSEALKGTAGTVVKGLIIQKASYVPFSDLVTPC